MPELSKFQLNINYWYLIHKAAIKKWVKIVLVAVDLMLFVYMLTNFLLYVIFTPRHERLLTSMVTQQIDYQALRTSSLPKSLSILNTYGVPVGTQFDLVAKVKNYNHSWAFKSFQYRFHYDGQQTDWLTGFILPLEEKYLVAFGQKSKLSSVPTNISIEIQNIEYSRIRDFDNFPWPKFQIKNARYDRVEVSGTTPKSLGQVTADITNQSVNGFQSVTFYLALYLGDKLAGINRVTLDDFLSQETRALQYNWQTFLPGITKVEVIPEVDVLNPDMIISL